MEEQEYKAKWWIPGNEKEKIHGTLNYSKNKGLELELEGTLNGDIERSRLSRYPAIFGYTQNGKKISLVDCVVYPPSLSFPGYATQECYADIAVIGAHIRVFEKETYSKAIIQYTHLPEWIGLTGFRERLETTKNKGLNKWVLEYQFPNNELGDIDLGQVSTEFIFHESRTDILREVTARQSTSFKIELIKPLSFEIITKCFVKPIRNLLNIATGLPNSINAISLVPLDSKSPDSSRPAKPIEVLCARLMGNIDDRKRVHTSEMLFTFKDMEDDFGKLIDLWLKAHEELDPVCNLYFGVLYAPQMYLEEEFLSFVQAAETYHRRRFDNFVLTKSDHKKRIESIIENVPEDYRKWLKEQLNFSNEPRLRKRISDLVEKPGRAINPLISNSRKFVTDVVYTRNYLTHYDPRLKNKAVLGKELINLTTALSYLVKICLLMEVGFSEDKCDELLRRNPDFMRASRSSRYSD